MVEDNVAQVPNVPQGEETIVDAGKAEPGHDIFAAPPQPEVMSEDKPNLPPVEGNEPKAVSAVGVSSSEAAPRQDERAPEMPEGRAPTAQLGDGSPLPLPPDNTPSPAVAGAAVGAEAAKAKVQGPMDAEQAEADEVRQELFPDAVA